MEKYRLIRQIDFQSVQSMIGFEKAQKIAEMKFGSIIFENHEVKVSFDEQTDLFRFFDYETNLCIDKGGHKRCLRNLQKNSIRKLLKSISEILDIEILLTTY